MLRGLDQADLNLGVLQETKIVDGLYTRGSVGYSVVTTGALSQHRSRVAVIYRASLWFLVEAIQQFELSVFIFQMAMGERLWYIIGCYLSPDDASAVEIAVAALGEFSRGFKLLVTGDFNANISIPEGAEWGEEIAAALVAAGLEDISDHFLPR